MMDSMMRWSIEDKFKERGQLPYKSCVNPELINRVPFAAAVSTLANKPSPVKHKQPNWEKRSSKQGKTPTTINGNEIHRC